MKKVIGILAVVAFAANMASAELLKNAKYNGSVEVKSVTVANYPGFDADLKQKYSQTTSRVMLGVNFDLNDDVNAQLTAVKCDYRNYGTASQDLNTLQSNVKFEEAYMNLKNVFGVNHRLGRQFFGNPGDMVVYFGPTSNLGQAYSASALDAWYGEYKKDKLTVGALMGKVTENSLTAMRDKDVYGVTAAYDYRAELQPSLYIYQVDDRVASVVSAKPNIAGVKVTGKYQGVGYGAEFAMNSGNNGATDYTGTAMKANVDYALDAKTAGKFVFMGEYAMGSGNDTTTADKEEGFQAVNSNYVPGLLFGGVDGNSGLNDLTTFNIGATWIPQQLEKLTIGAKFFNFAYAEDKGTAPNTYTAIGTELDFSATWKHSDNVGLRASYAMFVPSSDYNVTTDAANLLGLDLVVKF